MEFRKIPQNFSCWPAIIQDKEKFSAFCNDFNIISMSKHGGIGHLNASYFIKLLQNKYRRGCSMYRGDVLSKYQYPIFDHARLWKLKDNSTICVSMPYFTGENILDIFLRMKKEFSFPDSIQLKFLDSKYRFLPNGDYFFMIYDCEVFKHGNINDAQV